ncbi:chaperonin 10-like protein [Schizophyllum fasciatum]
MALPDTQKQYVFPEFKGFRNLTLREAPVIAPARDEVLVRIHAVSLNYRDLLVSEGKYPRPTKSAPLVPCADLAGEIVAVGPDAEGWKAGDRVIGSPTPTFTSGAFRDAGRVADYGAGQEGVLTEYKIVSAQSLVQIPAHLSYEEASTLLAAPLTAYNALFSGPEPVKPGDYVLTLGTGGVSMQSLTRISSSGALQLAVAAGAIVIVTSSSEEKLEVARRLGAKHTVNYRQVPDWHEEVLKITGGRGVDHVIEVGGPGTLLKSVKSCVVGAKIHLIGFLAEGTLESEILFEAIVKTLTLRGILVGSVAQLREMMRIVDVAKIKPVVDKIFSFDKAVEAFEHLEKQLFLGKVVVRVS